MSCAFCLSWQPLLLPRSRCGIAPGTSSLSAAMSCFCLFFSSAPFIPPRYVPNSVRAPSHQVCSEFCQGSIPPRYAPNSVRAPYTCVLGGGCIYDTDIPPRYALNSVRAPSHQGMLRILSGLHLSKVCSEFCQGTISPRYASNSVRAPYTCEGEGGI